MKKIFLILFFILGLSSISSNFNKVSAAYCSGDRECCQADTQRRCDGDANSQTCSSIRDCPSGICAVPDPIPVNCSQSNYCNFYATPNSCNNSFLLNGCFNSNMEPVEILCGWYDPGPVDPDPDPDPVDPPPTDDCSPNQCIPLSLAPNNCGDAGLAPAPGSCTNGRCCVEKSGGAEVCNCCHDSGWVSSVYPPFTDCNVLIANGGPNLWPQGAIAGLNHQCSFCSCTPTCPVACGQANGCGGTCPNTSAGTPETPIILYPSSGGTVYASPGDEITIDWSNAAKADYYQIELYDGITGSFLARYDTIQSSYTFTPTLEQYSFRVRAVNNTCGNEYSPWTSFSSFEASRPIWFRVVGGSVFANGSIISPIPDTISPNHFILDNADGYPGVAIHASGTADFSLSISSSGSVSSTNWLAQSGYSGQSYTYEYLESLIPDSTAVNTISGGVAGQATFNSATADSDGYTWVRHSGNLALTGNIVISGKKVVLLVENGSLTINGNITRGSAQNDFFMAIVQNNINVNSAVANLEGIYFAGNQFLTGSSTNQFTLTGSVVANNFVLERDLEAGNATDPSELFEFDPNIYANYPQTLNPPSIIWREVAP